MTPTLHGNNWPQSVVEWQKNHGRNDLPWQNTRDPYRVWLSEIMLQQTQVATVKSYFARFIAQLPDVAALAQASQDQVMGLWSGLGYYSRARNLHRCAQMVMALHQGQFPRDAALLVQLPGIGRSTANAIASVCFGQRVAILDANVKRVLTRALAFSGDLARAAEERNLWNAASAMLPLQAESMPRYAQGMMDLGATVCLPRKPLCQQCPVQSLCLAFKQHNPQDYPVRVRKLKRSSQALWLLWLRTTDHATWLVKRPQSGIWAGLQCLPVFDSEDALLQAVPAAWHPQLQALPLCMHVLTHKDLHLHTMVLELDLGTIPSPLPSGQWFTAAQWTDAGLPAPIRKLLVSGKASD
jgi:A/G-specific adenine glycosylase